MSEESPEPQRKAGEIAATLFRHEGARLVATLTAHLGTHRLQLAEDVVQEALVRALQTWPYRGVPHNPAAWLTQTAKNLALDFMRREHRWNEKSDNISAEHERWLSVPELSESSETFGDETLRLMFVCFHPQLSAEAQIALALRTLCGLSPGEIAAAFLTTEAAISKRLVRARQRIRELALPFAVPEPGELPARLDGVLGTLYLLFNEGYKTSSGDALVRKELCHEAIRLALLLTQHSGTAEPRTFALLSLMMLNAARLPARTDDAGNILRLHEQDRAMWDQDLIQRGIQALGRAACGESLSTYHLEAAIAACHSTVAHDSATDWPRILSVYDRLVQLNPSPVVALNRAVAVARVHGPQAGLEALDLIAARTPLESYYLYHVVRGTFAFELHHFDSALLSFQKAGTLVTQSSERIFISRRIQECEQRK